MTSTDPSTLQAQPSGSALFAPLSLQENKILHAHLTSGWYKQSVVYPALTGSWQETAALLSDLDDAWQAAFDAQQAARTPAEPPEAEPEPEPGL